MDLRPGALDDKIRQASLDRIRGIRLVPYFHPLKIICHPAFDDRYYVDCDDYGWRVALKHGQSDALAKTLKQYCPGKCLWKRARILRRLFDALSSDSICFCLDTGHFNVFSYTPLNIGCRTGIFRTPALHDNRGKTDEHLPVATARSFYWAFSDSQGNRSEAYDDTGGSWRKWPWESLNNIKNMNLLDYNIRWVKYNQGNTLFKVYRKKNIIYDSAFAGNYDHLFFSLCTWLPVLHWFADQMNPKASVQMKERLQTLYDWISRSCAVWSWLKKISHEFGHFVFVPIACLPPNKETAAIPSW